MAGERWAKTVMVWSLLLLPLLSWISVSDLRRREIPDMASLLVALVGALLWAGSPNDLFWNTIASVATALALGIAGGIFWRRTGREWLGLGDAKLIGAGTMVVGWDALWVMLFLASVGGICAAFATRWRSVERDIPFGPFLAYAILVTHLIAGPLP